MPPYSMYSHFASEQQYSCSVRFRQEEHNDGARPMAWRDDVPSAVERLLADYPNCAHIALGRVAPPLKPARFDSRLTIGSGHGASSLR